MIAGPGAGPSALTVRARCHKLCRISAVVQCRAMQVETNMSKGFGRMIYRLYRRLKAHCLLKKPSLLGRLFFIAVEKTDKILSPRQKMTSEERLERMMWKMGYFQRFGTKPLFRVTTQRPVAVDSDDHKWPR